MNTQTVSLFNKPAGIKHVMYVFRIEIVLGHNELSSMWPYHKYLLQTNGNISFSVSRITPFHFLLTNL